jgi:glycosyltransferase involved in cell wall biosynthesis
MPCPDPLVTVVTPAYNTAPFLADTLESALHQSFPDFEILVVDDASTDGTLDIARAFAERDCRVRVATRPNGGAGAARNMALGQGRGQYFALLDSDDQWAPTFLAEQLELFARFPDADVVTVNAINIGGTDKDGSPLWPTEPEVAWLALVDLIEREDSVCIMSVFRRRVYETIGGFAERSRGVDDTLSFRGNEDYHFWLRAARHGFRFLANHTPSCYYRRRPDSLSADEGEMLKGIVAVLQEAQSMCAGLEVESEAIRRQLAHFSREIVTSQLRRALRTGDASGVSECLRTLASCSNERTVQLAARLSGIWPVPLIWAYHARRVLRPR